ncbi:DUF2199 domain-containing protein [Roseicyclus persicicus]|uniref:DUF2199 domain-containing protein n=1 Tax=Roseicyclus persicicus TaxID=2650661 RepID=A0A7X6H340_9RHOB|nr:DUF2199 domain-containing protein [Roseibacterium persicicum]NKX45892.1 DUF2199 domain-containing protein [Roseibacterium persicicum]
MLKLFRRSKAPKPISEAELARRLTAPGYRCACCGEVWDAANAVRLRPFGWAHPPAPLPDEALDGSGDVVTERYARRGRDLLVRAKLPIPVRGTDEHVFLQVWANLSTGDFARFRSAQGRGDADRLGDLFAWLYSRVPAASGPVLSKGVIVPVAGGGMPVYWITDPKHPLLAAQQDGGLTAPEIAALYEDLGAGELLRHLRA